MLCAEENDTYATIDLKSVGVSKEKNESTCQVQDKLIFLQAGEVLGIEGRNEIVSVF